MAKKNVLFSMLVFSSILVFTGCSDTDDDIVLSQPKLKETSLPVIVDENTSKKEVVVDGKTYIFNIHNDIPSTRSIGDVGGEKIYPRDPNATLASVPVMVSKGTYKKYASKAFSPFADLAGVSIVMLRLDKFTFECVAPSNAKQTSFDITNITKEGFATESASYKGFSIDKILSTTSGVIVKCSFYIQDGIAYDIAGQQLTDNTYYPFPGNEVRYQFTYDVRK